PRASLLPLLHFSTAPADELPDLDHIAMWAHAQVTGAAPADDHAIRGALGGPAGQRLSRLICPRKLEPRTRYLACLVPTYRVGVRVGISPDLPGDNSDVAPAWRASPPAGFDLRVYWSWRFGTGDEGDFASLASRLHPPTAPLTVGLRPVDVSDAQ